MSRKNKGMKVIARIENTTTNTENKREPEQMIKTEDKKVETITPTDSEVKKPDEVMIQKKKPGRPKKNPETGIVTQKSEQPIARVTESKMSMAEGVEIREKIRELKDRIEADYFEMASMLHIVYDTELYLDWGHATFRDYVTAELGFSERKAHYLVGIHDYFVNELGDSVVIDKIKPLGWSKVKELKDVVTPDNVDEWVDRAQNMNVLALAAAAQQALKSGSGTSFGSGQGGVDPDLVEAPRSMTFKLFPAQYENITAALTRASELSDSKKTGHNLDMIAVDFLAMNAFTSGGDKSMDEFLTKFDGVLKKKLFAFDPATGKCHGEDGGVRIVVVDVENEKILYGEDVLEMILEDDSETPKDEGEKENIDKNDGATDNTDNTDNTDGDGDAGGDEELTPEEAYEELMKKTQEELVELASEEDIAFEEGASREELAKLIISKLLEE